MSAQRPPASSNIRLGLAEPGVSSLPLGHGAARPRHETPASLPRARAGDAGYWRVKRAIDVVAAALLLLLLSPLLLLVACAIKLHSPGPVFFVQERVGYDRAAGKIRRFMLYKFRSMRMDADPNVHRQHMRSLIRENIAPAGPRGTVKLVGDHRITGLGRLLRRSSIDELPQLINVLKGDMSLVGPRPALPYEVECYEEWHKLRLQALPGMTGWWQVMGRCRTSFDEGVRMDIYYVERASLALDLKILFLTPLAVLTGRGAG